METTQTAEPIASPAISPESSKEIIAILTKEGQKLLPAIPTQGDPGFVIMSEEKDYYLNLFLYFKKNPLCTWDLKKGLLIAGHVGTGKSFSIKFMQHLFRCFGIVNTRHIIRDYLQDGMPVLDMYGRKSFKMNGPHGAINYKESITWSFDDFGQENTNTKLWGNQINLIEEIFTDRYEMFEQHGLITHATSNVNPAAIELAYGVRVRDRLRKMMNLITLTGKSKRK